MESDIQLRDYKRKRICNEEMHGSVTKEYESIHAQTLQLSKFYSKLKLTLSKSSYRPDLPFSAPHLETADSNDANGKRFSDQQADAFNAIVHEKIHSVISGSQDLLSSNEDGSNSKTIIYIDSDEENQKQKEEIIIDSDEEIGKEKEEKECVTSPKRKSFDFRTCQSRSKAGLLEQESNTNRSSFGLAASRNTVNAKLTDETDGKMSQHPVIHYQKVTLTRATGNASFIDLVDLNHEKNKNKEKENFSYTPVATKESGKPEGPDEEKGEVLDSSEIASQESLALEETNYEAMQLESPNTKSDLLYDSVTSKNDDLEDLWKEMALAADYSNITQNFSIDETEVVRSEEECEHFYVLKDDLGLVCRICGLIKKSIEKIFDYQWPKGYRSTRTYPSGSPNPKDVDGRSILSGSRIPLGDLLATEISIHPRHEKIMKLHQLEGFGFLVRNLLTDEPGGCILAHAPGSGKTFMLISFIQSFLGKYPSARTLIILPKGILSTWKREFQKWQVEELHLYDFYSSKADKRYQQLEILKCWEENKSVLFLGYTQFANIVCNDSKDEITAACEQRLLKVPTLLIIDEGHTPRNEETNMVNSLSRIQTPRKIVLSGTLYQNHVKEVFNILDLVRPRFLKMKSSREIVRRILSRVQISGRRHNPSGSFFELVEETLQNDDNFNRKVAVIQDLREMTQDVLHYYKGDFLEELPGIVDLTIFLNLSVKQKLLIRKLGKLDLLKRLSICSNIYVHPELKDIAANAGRENAGSLQEKMIGDILDTVDINVGVKTKFFWNILSMSEISGEKLLVFSQYLLSLRFLEKLLARLKGWHLGKEIFMISGKSTSEQREYSMEQFNKSADAKVLFGSIKACGEGISLIGASRVIILDVHWNPSVSRQAIGRAYRPGQTKKVYVYRLVASDSTEEENHKTSSRKELTSKMWFEWNEHCGYQDFSLAAVDIRDCDDAFMENPRFDGDIKCLYRKYM